MNIILIGTVEFSKCMLEVLLDYRAEVVGVITSSNSGFNSDFVDLEPLCRKHALEVFRTNNINSLETVEWIKSKKADIMICVGWSSIIKKNILNLTPMGVVGYHPTALPKNRGRHPIIWALALGLTKTGSTFFQMDEGVDSGDILSQRSVLIDSRDDAFTLYRKIIAVASRQLIKLIEGLHNSSIKRVPQNHNKANYWRKRTHKMVKLTGE